MTGTPYAAGGIRTTVAATRAATDEQLTAHVARLVAEMRRQGTTTVEIKSGYGLTVHDEARSLAIARAVHRGDDLPRRPRRAGRARRRPGGVRRPGHRPDARRRRAARPLDRRVLRAGRLRRRPGPRGAGRRRRGRAARPAARQPARPRPRRAAGLRARPGRRRPLHLPRPTPTSPRSPTPAPSRPCCRAWSSRPASPTPTPAGCSTPACASRSPATATPARASPASLPFCIALAVREMGMTPAEAVHAATAGGAAALDRDDVGRLTVGARADLSVLDAPEPPAPRLPPRRTPGHAAPGCGRADPTRRERASRPGLQVAASGHALRTAKAPPDVRAYLRERISSYDAGTRPALR